MSTSRLNNQKRWQELQQRAGDDLALFDILTCLVRQHIHTKPTYIGAYELESIVDDLGLDKTEKWKSLINFLCFETQLLELNFRLIDDSDNHHEISFEELQSIIAGEELVCGATIYDSKAALNKIFPYFIPTEYFYQLLEIEGNPDA
jgi:hypothetical protein